MKLKIKYLGFVVGIHLVCLVLSYLIFEENRMFFILSEALILISIVVSLRLYRQLIAPLYYLKQGINAIKDKDFNVKFLPTGQGEIDELVQVYNRMIDELRSERTKQQEQHFFLEKLIQTSPTGIIILDFDKQIKQINPKATEILKRYPSLNLEYAQNLKIGESKTLRLSGMHTYKVQKSSFMDRGFERTFIMIEELTTEILEAEKNVYSKVIRMMAHEVNNTIGPVNSIIHSAMNHKLLQGQGDLQLTNALQVAIDRNQNLNIFMRNFADLVKLPEARKKPIDVVALTKSVSELMQFATQGKEITFNQDLPSVPFIIHADIQQMEQALINIVKNAIEAVESKGIVKFELNTLNKELRIINTGKGIAKGSADQLFSPFFSTKKDGQGIGLTLVREILLSHGYEFSLSTTDDLTYFIIKFNAQKPPQ